MVSKPIDNLQSFILTILEEYTVELVLVRSCFCHKTFLLDFVFYINYAEIIKNSFSSFILTACIRE